MVAMITVPWYQPSVLIASVKCAVLAPKTNGFELLFSKQPVLQTVPGMRHRVARSYELAAEQPSHVVEELQRIACHITSKRLCWFALESMCVVTAANASTKPEDQNITIRYTTPSSYPHTNHIGSLFVCFSDTTTHIVHAKYQILLNKRYLISTASGPISINIIRDVKDVVIYKFAIWTERPVNVDDHGSRPRLDRIICVANTPRFAAVIEKPFVKFFDERHANTIPCLEATHDFKLLAQNIATFIRYTNHPVAVPLFGYYINDDVADRLAPIDKQFVASLEEHVGKPKIVVARMTITCTQHRQVLLAGTFPVRFLFSLF